ncbi:MAG: TIGR00701 family protein [Rickettsiales bacterium]|nr:TIGR00701 family protein [Rickettsiales bacterium]
MYNFLKYTHYIFFTTWMAGLFYLPRIFVYHSQSNKNSSEYETFVVMERKLLKYIMNPSLVLTWIVGLGLLINQQAYNFLWMNLKFLCVILMSAFHMYCGNIRRSFENKTNLRSGKYFRIINEIPTVLFLTIVGLVVFKPFV